MSLAKRIRDFRYSKGWGPDELALRADVSRTALYQIECGKTETPRAGTLRRIAEALEVPIDRLLAESAAAAAAPSNGDGRDGDDEHPFEFVLSRGPQRSDELERMFRELLTSPFGEGIARLVEDSHRMLPMRQSR
jgi:transcriptional regulator with XRE-family HTH domain